MTFSTSKQATGRIGVPERLRGIVLPEVCRISDLIEHTGISAETWKSELCLGALPGRQVNGEWFVHRAAVQDWLCSGAQEVSQ